MQNDIDINVIANKLLQQAGFLTDIITITPCAKGGNNRTFQLTTSVKTFALKQYFRQNTDKRDRLDSEYRFLTYANCVAPQFVPRVFARDTEYGVALYEFVEGKAIEASSITKADVLAAATFFCELNAKTELKQASSLPFASEACFSIEEHLSLLARRIENLQQSTIAESREIRDFIADFARIFTLENDKILKNKEFFHVEISENLAIYDRCISPSDFGFHNALRLHDGAIKFLDFEYAGFDDPAKMVGDFFSQLAVPVSDQYFDEFTQIVMMPFRNRNQLIQRAKLLRPIYRLKWCCIALNIFIPANLARRQFANPDLNVDLFKQQQLQKAATILDSLTAEALS